MAPARQMCRGDVLQEYQHFCSNQHGGTEHSGCRAPLYTKTAALSSQNSTSHQPPKYSSTCSGSRVRMGRLRAVPVVGRQNGRRAIQRLKRFSRGQKASAAFLAPATHPQRAWRCQEVDLALINLMSRRSSVLLLRRVCVGGLLLCAAAGYPCHRCGRHSNNLRYAGRQGVNETLSVAVK